MGYKNLLTENWKDNKFYVKYITLLLLQYYNIVIAKNQGFSPSTRKGDWTWKLDRSNRSRMFFKKSVLKSFAIFTLQACNFIKKRRRLFVCEYCETFKKIIFYEHLWWLAMTRTWRLKRETAVGLELTTT